MQRSYASNNLANSAARFITRELLPLISGLRRSQAVLSRRNGHPGEGVAYRSTIPARSA